MKVIETALADVLILEPTAHVDDRGCFYESFRQDWLIDVVGFHGSFVQDNHSRSSRGVLRGLHYQVTPAAQAKLVRVVAGSVFDVAVDVRRSSPTFGRWIGAVLSAENRHQLWIPEGFAHGFLVLSDEADVVYKVSDYYSPDHDRALRWDDPQVGVQWPLDGVSPGLSDKDRAAPGLDEAEVFA